MQRRDHLKPSVEMMQHIAAEIDVAHVGYILYRVWNRFQAEIVPQHLFAVFQYCPEKFLGPFNALALQYLRHSHTS
jgi:hypothetical protein